MVHCGIFHWKDFTIETALKTHAAYYNLLLHFKFMRPLAGVKIMTVSCCVCRHEMTDDHRYQSKCVFIFHAVCGLFTRPLTQHFSYFTLFTFTLKFTFTFMHLGDVTFIHLGIQGIHFITFIILLKPSCTVLIFELWISVNMFFFLKFCGFSSFRVMNMHAKFQHADVFWHVEK